eukprot:CAMPEP_0178877046 /NCGR_PEP_ID=MMETSP0747-20121128/10620_1 /TAXON_ID=913974 /ORGANISM="Nitzschia punctata, Strain CCMP561" /LENGTH=189 /DNA_ID=CAMNT_0020544645 /DNA_START=199 /DNA_END=768 /DNA_ORIENTATION=+
MTRTNLDKSVTHTRDVHYAMTIRMTVPWKITLLTTTTSKRIVSVPDSSRNKNNPNLSDNHKADPVVRSFTEPRQNQDEESGTPTSEIPTTFTFEEGDDNDIENSDIDETATSNQGDSQQDDSLQGNTNIAIIRHYSPPQENNVQGDSIFFPFQTSSDNIFSPGRSRQRIPPNARTANMRAVMPNHHFPE